MDEIYLNHADRYHELVLAEDYENNLGRLLHDLVDWQGLSILEAGVGTGMELWSFHNELYPRCRDSRYDCVTRCKRQPKP